VKPNSRSHHGAETVSMSENAAAGLALREKDLDALLPVLTRLREGSHSRAVLLIDSGGGVLGEVGETLGLDLTALGRLAASSVTATSSLAQVIGEKEFTILFHQGERESIHLTLVEEGVILAVLFGKGAALGLIRLRVRKASEEVKRILRGSEGRSSRTTWWAEGPPSEITAQDIDDLFTF
jgi:predicted regulator of Ras-like GTPase activity (Roadblock/LC7/MglB family)